MSEVDIGVTASLGGFMLYGCNSSVADIDDVGYGGVIKLPPHDFPHGVVTFGKVILEYNTKAVMDMARAAG